MRFRITSDSNWECRVDEATRAWSQRKYREYFEGKEYGAGLACIALVLMCRDPAYGFEQRVTLVKKEKTLCMDIMLDHNQMVSATTEERIRIVSARVVSEVPRILAKYKIDEFDSVKFLTDLNTFVRKAGWLPKTA